MKSAPKAALNITGLEAADWTLAIDFSRQFFDFA
jgi:hypothetical protein